MNLEEKKYFIQLLYFAVSNEIASQRKDEYDAILLHCISHAMSRSLNKNQTTKGKYRRAGYQTFLLYFSD